MSKTMTGWLCRDMTKAGGTVVFVPPVVCLEEGAWWPKAEGRCWNKLASFLAEYDCVDFDPPKPGEKLLVELEI